jgi:hypothetical protein
VAHFPAALRLALNTQVTNAFMEGLHRGCFVAAGAAFVAAIFVLTQLPRAIPVKSDEIVAHA